MEQSIKKGLIKHTHTHNDRLRGGRDIDTTFHLDLSNNLGISIEIMIMYLGMNTHTNTIKIEVPALKRQPSN